MRKTRLLVLMFLLGTSIAVADESMPTDEAATSSDRQGTLPELIPNSAPPAGPFSGDRAQAEPHDDPGNSAESDEATLQPVDVPSRQEGLDTSPGLDSQPQQIASAETQGQSAGQIGNDGISNATYVEDSEYVTTPSRFSLHYFGILYGPSLKSPSSNQPDPNTGLDDPSRPVVVKNLATLGYNFTPEFSVAGTAYWLWRPVQGQQLTPLDPFVRAAYNGVLRSERFNLYSDLRLHLPTTKISRSNDLKMGVQTFNAAHYVVGDGQLLLGLYGSIRYNVFGKSGYGNDVEYYLGPNLSYQIIPSLSFTLLYEMGASHLFGNSPLSLDNDGTALEPGLNWEVTRNLAINPYLNIYTGNSMSLASTTLGMTLSWQVF